MRNWNFFESRCLGASGPGFYRTYEELKRGTGDNLHDFSYFVFIVPMRNWNLSALPHPILQSWSFYRTYEELKHIKVCHLSNHLAQFLSYLWGIETKHVQLLLSSYSIVFIVPMRNWNSAGVLCMNCSQISFLSYLWGIETLVCHPRDILSLCFYRTYEELKPEDETLEIFESIVFIVPMRNWNQILTFINLTIPQFFIVPMRNWNITAR